MRYFLILLLSWLPLLASAVDFDENTRALPLGKYMQVFEDVRGGTTIDDVLGPALAESFHGHDQDTLNAGYSHSVFWVRLDLHYAPHTVTGVTPWFLELAYPPLDQIDLYLPDAQGGYRLAQRTGDSQPFQSRQIKQHNYLFELDFQPDQRQVVYLRIQSEGSIQIPLTLWSNRAYIEEQPARLYVLGVIYGVLLVMLVYNLFIYLSVRDTSYLYYILYIASFGLYQLSVNGAAVQYFWPDNPWWANAATPLFIGAAIAFGCQFSRSFLRTATYSPWVDRALRLLMAAGVLVSVLALWASYGLAVRLATQAALAFTILIFITGSLAWLRGMRVARYFMIAWSALLLGGLVNTFMVLGYLPNVFLTMYASQIGSAVEVALLSLALADRINAMKEERARLLKANARELARLNEQLAVASRHKDEFLASLTHELRTPMNGVIGSLELMQTLSTPLELAQYQLAAAGSAREMMGMVDSILCLTELQSGRLVARSEAFSLRALVDGLRMRFASVATAKGLSFVVEMGDGLPDTLQGDSAKLAQALGCLLDNAFKFTRHGGVTLRVKRGVAVSADLALQFEVIDTGIGFVELFEGQLYGPFSQADASSTRAYGGLGIGLAICWRLVALFDGQLSHRSEQGMGSRFRLRVELDQAPQATNAVSPGLANSAPLLHAPQQFTVLVVEDNSINQLVIRGMLLKLGYNVRTADNGADALELLGREPVDAVLLDCQMPVLDGFATCRALRQLPGRGNLPVLAVTAYSHSGDRERCLAAGMSDYLTKPLRFVDLQAALELWLLSKP